MKIASANIEMASTHADFSRHEVRESLRAWIGSRRPDFEGAARGRAPETTVSISQEAAAAAKTDTPRDGAEVEESDPRLLLIKTMVELLTGRRIRTITQESLRPDAEPIDVPDPHQGAAPGREGAGWGIEYDRHESVDEVEQTQFAAQGVIRTSDGQEIRFSLDVSMARAWHEESGVSLRAGDARRKDPLVLNFDGTAAELAATRFQFDLDADGRAEETPLLGGGSGYLALDRNGNGRIDSGAELFGPQSGDGYAELAQYDVDGNRWIDGNDPVFERLRLWSPTAEGGGRLETLAQRNVGALFLGNLATPFELRSASNDSLGAVRSTGLYLTEDGNAGSMQQIDLTV